MEEEEGSGRRESGARRDERCGKGEEGNIKGNIKDFLDTVNKYVLNV